MRLFSIADFRRLWLIGFTFSVVRWLETLALALYAYQLTASAFVVAMLTMLRLLPMGLFGAFFGAASERFDRRRVLILVVAVQTTVSLTLAVLASFDAIAIWHLASASFINGTGWATDHPVRRMMIGDSVGAERVGTALSLDTASNNGTRVLGPVLSGVLLAHFGIVSVFCFSIALYVPSLFAAIHIGMRREGSHARALSFFSSIREGLAWARNDRGLMGVFLITIIYNIFGWPATSMVPVIGTDALRLGPEGVGLLAACDGVGGLVGALLVAGRARPAYYGRLYVGAVAMYLVMVVLFAASPVAPAAGLALLLGGTSGAAFAVMQATLVYRSAPVHMRARLLGVISVCIGTGPIGFLYLGWLAEILTPAIATMALAAQGLVVMAATRRYWRPTLRL
ncbi:MAG TPA: MFS transporter [Burkholderiales bacterium]|nr:MFS transporter [Burkholderiales bacterium]